MRVKITVEKVITAENKVLSFSTAQDQYVEGDNLRFFSGPSAKLVVLQVLGDGRANQYYTDFAWSGVAAILDAAPTAANQWVLT